MSDSTDLEEIPKPGDATSIERVPSNLTTEQRQAAMLEAVGYSDRESAAVVGVSKQTIQRYRREIEGYKTAVEIYKTRDTKLMEPLVARYKVELLDAAREAIVSLREALSAETLDGQPRWPVRNEAAALILSHVNVAVGSVQVESGQGSDSDAHATSREPLVIQINPAPQPPAHVDSEVVDDAEVVD